MTAALAFGRVPGVEIVAHKLYGPAENKGTVRRDVILGRIFNEHSARAVLIQGPAGHGKTTLLQQAKAFSEELGNLSGWLSFDEGDNDPQRLFLHIHALITKVYRAAHPEQTMSSGVDSDKGILSNPADWFINCLREIGRPVSLFFDEFHQLQEPGILRFFREVLEFMPENVRIFIGSRNIPEIGFARLVANNLAFVFRTEDIRFSLDEACRFFSMNGELNIRQDELQTIYAQTEGWPAALQLFRLALVSPSVRGSLRDLPNFRPPELADYLADYVLALQAREIQDFLLRVSPLTRLSPELCDAVTGSKFSRETLLVLERSGLFVRRLDSGGKWFRMHSLFASFLRDQLRQASPAAYVEVHRQALAWYEAQGSYEEAMYHAVAIKDYPRAADMLDTWASELISTGHLMTVERWWQRLPFDEMRRRMDLVVKVTWAQTFLRRQETLSSLLPVLEGEGAACAGTAGVTDPRVIQAMACILVDDLPRSLETIRPVQTTGANPEGFAAFELGAAANLQGYFHQAAGDFETARQTLACAQRFSESVGATFSLAYTHANAGITFFLQGRLQEAIDCFRGAIDDSHIRISESIAAASLASCYVQALYEANEIDLAESVFNEFHAIISKATLLDYLAVAYVSMVRIHDLKGRREKARALLDEAEAIGFANSLPRLVRIVKWERIRRFLLSDDMDRARSLAHRLSEQREPPALPEGWIPFSEDSEGVAVGQIRLAVHAGRPEEAVRLATRELADARRTGRVRRQIRLNTLEALAYAKLGDAANAQRSFRMALELAAESGLVRTVLDEGESVARLLRERRASSGRAPLTASEALVNGFVASLLNRIGSEPENQEETTTFLPLEPLTRREVDILILLANGVSNKEMARRLFVSENTVKFHLKNAYSKLGVNSRVKAINAARKMALL